MTDNKKPSKASKTGKSGAKQKYVTLDGPPLMRNVSSEKSVRDHVSVKDIQDMMAKQPRKK